MPKCLCSNLNAKYVHLIIFCLLYKILCRKNLYKLFTYDILNVKILLVSN